MEQTQSKIQRVVGIKVILHGITDEQTAFVVNDYPYGFRLRTQKRYWIETNKKQGDRVVSQTLNPKTNKWNKPKRSTYSSVKVGYLNEQGHFTWVGISKGWSNDEVIDKFLDFVGADYKFNEHQREQIKVSRAINQVNKHITVKCVNATNWTKEQKEQHEAEQQGVKENIGKLFAHEYAKLG